MNYSEIFQSSDNPYIQQSYTKLGLSQRERDIFESADFDYASGVVLKREERESEKPSYLQLQNIMTRTGMTRRQAMKWRRYLTRIAPNMHKTFEGWMKQRGIEPGLRYFRYLSERLHEEDTPSSDYFEDRPGESYTSDYWRPLSENGTMPWILKQPSWVRAFLRKPEKYGDLKSLRSFGRKVYEASRRKELMNPDQRTYMALSHDQQSVFWTNYAIQRQKLESQVRLSDIARRIIDRINSIPDPDLPHAGKKLYEMQNGKIPMKQKPTDEEWTRIWVAYRRRKGRSRRIRKNLHTEISLS